MTRGMVSEQIARLIALSFCFIKMAGRLIEQEQARPPIERASQNNPLYLSAGKRTPHIADQRLIAHRQTDHLIMDGRKAGSRFHNWRSTLSAKPAMLSAIDPANSRSSCSTQPICARYSARPRACNRQAVQRDRAALRPQQSGQYLEEGGLARAGWTDDGDALAHRDIEIGPRDDLGLVVAITEMNIPGAEHRIRKRQR